MLKVGDEVVIVLPEKTDTNICKELKAFDGSIAKVQTIICKGTEPQYILEGVESKKGMPFFLLGAWLQRMR